MRVGPVLAAAGDWGFFLLLSSVAAEILRLRNVLHVFQLEGYKRDRFLEWCRTHPQERFLKPIGSKKPLVMTGRAWRLILVAASLVALGVLGPALIVRAVIGPFYGWMTGLIVGFALSSARENVLVAADRLLAPVQGRLNAGFERAARARLEDVAPVIIGVTGSFGKTSTKFAVARLLGPPETAAATPGSYNTPMGVVRAINEGLTDRHRFLVVEMGAYGVGEIAALCNLVHPTIGVLTAIGPAHLERFGSLDAIRRAKYELVESLPADGLAVMNTDDPEVRTLADRTTHVPVVRYGLDPAGSPHVTARDHGYSPRGTSATIVDTQGSELAVTTRLLGAHAISHVLAGVSVARHEGIPLADLGPRIAALEPVEHRLQLIDGPGGVTIIDDAFNSNPAGAAAAIEVLADFDATEVNQIVVVTPGIIELGARQAEANEAFGNHAARIADVLIVVGRTNRESIVRGAQGPGPVKADVIVVDRLDQATEHLKKLLGPRDVVLFENDLPDQYEL
jgi:UDP-N-acetylmuramoyl-tripeptide--D-alanyl-D-alanine ligase